MCAREIYKDNFSITNKIIIKERIIESWKEILKLSSMKKVPPTVRTLKMSLFELLSDWAAPYYVEFG